MLAGIIAGKVGTRFGVPALLLFLITGMLFGSAGLGIQYNDTNKTQFVGMIALAWTLLSYASALDLGIGRATTQYVSALRGKGDLAQIPPAIDVAWRLSITYSAIGVALFLVAVGFDVESLITYRNIGAQELKIATIILIFTLPVQVLSALYRGIIEAFEDFRVPSIVRMYLGVANFVAPNDT